MPVERRSSVDRPVDSAGSSRRSLALISRLRSPPSDPARRSARGFPLRPFEPGERVWPGIGGRPAIVHAWAGTGCGYRNWGTRRRTKPQRRRTGWQRCWMSPRGWETHTVTRPKCAQNPRERTEAIPRRPHPRPCEGDALSPSSPFAWATRLSQSSLSAVLALEMADHEKAMIAPELAQTSELVEEEPN